MAQYVYYRGSQGSRETVTYDIVRGSQYITTCVVDVQLLLCGVKAFPCGNGDDVKTYEGWQESGLPSFEDYCFPGDKVDDDMVQHFVDSVPPVLMLSFCTQAGEPYSSEADERGVRRPTFTTFHDLGGGYWQFDGYCFYKENTNRYTRKPRIEELIDEARREVGTDG